MAHWLFEVNRDSFLNTRDMAGLLHVSTTAVYRLVACGELPAPDEHILNFHGNRCLQWKVGTAIEAMKDRGLL